MSENLIAVMSIVAVVAISLVAFVALVTLPIYFTEKKITAAFKIKSEEESVKTETCVQVEASPENKKD